MRPFFVFDIQRGLKYLYAVNLMTP